MAKALRDCKRERRQIMQPKLDWKKCPYCGRMMVVSAKTCGNYCKWEELVNGKKR